MATDAPLGAADLFLGGYRGRAVRLLYRDPERDFHLRELARRTAAQPGTLRRELARLVSSGVLSCRRLGGLTLYRADPGCPIYEELRGIALKTTELATALRAALVALGEVVVVAYLRGDPAREPQELIVVASVAAEAVLDAVAGCGVATAGANGIRTRIYPPSALRKKARKKDPAAARAVKGRKVFLVGGWDDLRLLTGKARP